MDETLIESGAPRRGLSRSFTLGIGCYTILIVIWSLALIFYFSYVHASLVFTQSNPVAAITIADVPFYSYPGEPALNPAVSEIYASFDYYLWMSDYLLIFALVWSLGASLGALLFQMNSAFLVTIIAVLFAALELFKAIWWTLYLTNVFACNEYQFCINRNPAAPASTASSQFLVAVIMTYVFAALSLSLLGLNAVVKTAHLSRLQIGKKFDALAIGSAFGDRASAGSGGSPLHRRQSRSAAQQQQQPLPSAASRHRRSAAAPARSRSQPRSSAPTPKPYPSIADV